MIVLRICECLPRKQLEYELEQLISKACLLLGKQIYIKTKENQEQHHWGIQDQAYPMEENKLALTLVD